MMVSKIIKLIFGINLTLFNIGIFILTDNHIEPSYWDIIFPIYFLISCVVAFKFIIDYFYNQGMEIKNIKTSYGEFKTIIDYENYWKAKIRLLEEGK